MNSKRYGKLMILVLAMSLFLIIPASFASDNLTSDENCTVGLMVNLASANTYTYALAFSGDEDCNAAPLACSKLIVTKKPIAIAAKDCSFKVDAKTKTVTATLSTSKNPYDGKTYLSSGKKVTLKVNGNTYTGFDIEGTKNDSPIDFVFVKKDCVNVRSYKILRELIDGQEPSDHFPVLCEAEI